MKKLILIITIALALTGCQNSQIKNKQAALDRWNTARAQMSTNIARQQFGRGQFEKATLTVEKALKMDSKSPAAYLLLGQIKLQLNQVTSAQRALRQALTLDPQNAQANYYLGVVCERTNDLDGALTCYRSAFSTQPEHTPYLLALVETLVTMERSHEALDLVNDQLNLGRQDPATYMIAGNILTALNRPDEAIAMFQQSLSLKQNDQQITRELAFALLQAERFDQAQPLFEKLLGEKNNSSMTIAKTDDTGKLSLRLALGDCYLNLGNFHKARRCFEYVSRNDSSNPDIWIRLAQTALAQNDLNRAQAQAQKALNLKPNHTDALVVLAYVALKNNEHEKAEKYLQKIIAHDPDNSMAKKLLVTINNTKIAENPQSQNF